MSDVTGMVVSYRPGSWVGISGERVCVLLHADLEHPLVVPLHQKVAAGAEVDDLLEEILADGLRTTGAFALAQFIDDQVRVIARGDAVADVTDATGTTTRVSVASGVWADRRLDAVSVVLRPLSDEPAGPTLPLRAGVVRVSALAIGRGMPPRLDSHSAADPAATSSPAPSPTVAPPTVAPAAPPPVVASPVVVSPAGAPAAVPPAVAIPAGEAPGAASPGVASPAVASPAAGEPPVAAPVVPPTRPDEVDEHSDTFDDLLKHTMMQRPTPPAPVEVPPHPSTASAADGGGIPESAESAIDGRTLVPDEWPESPPAPATPPVSAGPLVDSRVVPPPPAGPGIIDAVPDFMRLTDGPAAHPAPGRPLAEPPARPSAATAVPPAAPAPPAAAHPRPDLTVNRSTLVGAGGSMRAAAPEVQAGHCPSGHLSPAHAAVCRVCGVSMPPQNAVWVPRPILGRLVFSNGDIVTLDRGLVLGRAPSLPAGHNGEQPNLVKLNDPTLEVSSQHLEVRLDHWYVLVVDLGSTNGTLVTLPGQQPIRLRPKIPHPIEPGTVVNLADVLSFTFEVTA